jgi:tetratricopeptide (TPR) repeat protein
MAWTRLTNQEEAVATRALTTFETIPLSVLDTILIEDQGKNRYELASIYQLLGVSAFYTNDIDAAVRCLERGLQIYGNEDAPAEHLFPQAFCSHFLGLAEKNWCHLDRPLEANIASAKRHLEEAARRLQTKEGEFLTPLTLAEVLSYSEQTREAARRELDNNIGRLDKLKNSGGLDANQDALYSRALLMRGNIDYLSGDLNQALTWYTRSHDHNRTNAYALLSMAQATPASESELRVTLFREGLALLEAPSGPLSKREPSVRISALAWAIIATREAVDTAGQDRYSRDLDAAGSYARPVGGRAPLFFCPVTKTLVMFDQLKKIVATSQVTEGKERLMQTASAGKP